MTTVTNLEMSHAGPNSAEHFTKSKFEPKYLTDYMTSGFPTPHKSTHAP